MGKYVTEGAESISGNAAPLQGNKGDDFEISKACFGVVSEIRIITQRGKLWEGTCVLSKEWAASERVPCHLRQLKLF